MSGGARPKLSVVLPCRNGAETLPLQLEALAAQEWHEPWEVVVSDNGSTDDTFAVLERFRGRLPSLKVVDASDTAGVSYALNAGVAAAEGEAIAFANADDRVGDGWLAAMGEALGRFGVVAGRLELDELNEPWAAAVRGRPQHDGLLEWGFEEYLPFAAGAALGVRRELHEAIGGFDESLTTAGEDMDYCWRLQQGGATIHFAPDAVVHYRVRHSLGGLFRQALAYGESHPRLYKKHRRLGLPPRRRALRRGLRSWASLGKRLPGIVSRPGRAAFLWQLGLRLGQLKGSIRHRVLFV